MRAGVKYYELSSVCTSITDGSHFSPKEDPEGLIPMLSVKDMAADGFDYTSCKYIGENDYQVLVANGCRPSVGDVLVAKDGSYLKTAFVQKSDKDQAILSSIAILTPKTDIIIPEYLALFFKAPHTKATVEKHYLTGTAIKRVILKGFKVIKAPVPPLSEQERIVAELDLLQGIIDKQKAQLKELDTLAQSIFYDMFGNPETNDKNWEIKTIGAVCAPKKDIRRAVKHFCKDDCIRYIDISSIDNIKNVITTPTLYRFGDAPSRAQQVVEINDVLISLVRPNLNNVAIVSLDDTNLVASSGFCVLRASSIIQTAFLFFIVKMKSFTEYLMQRVSGANYPAVREDDITGYPMIVPPLPLQQAFATKIEAIERQKASINASIAETQKLFDYTMDKYFG